MRQVKQITLDGVTKTVGQWAQDCDLNASTLDRRISQGWDVREAMTTRPDKPTVTKNNAELMLNEMTRDQLPDRLAKLVPPHYRGTKLGEYLRDYYRAEFDAWYEQVFKKNHEKK